MGVAKDVGVAHDVGLCLYLSLGFSLFARGRRVTPLKLSRRAISIIAFQTFEREPIFCSTQLQPGNSHFQAMTLLYQAEAVD